ncbi:Glutamate receptor 2.8 [Zea mays]|uniref:Glutamate receptor n=1 Tax=Zea mays TaxID=4577 RepID=A0A3L6DZA0_MAIZE|nr:Glutamate receptor 2.8 [Zea mays]
MEIANIIVLLLLLLPGVAAAQNASGGGMQEVHVGVILDLGSLVGKIAITSISLALEDFYAANQNYSTKLVLHIRDSKSDDVQAASQALDLLENYNVETIIGPEKSSQAMFISELGTKSHVPVISFTATSPTLSTSSLPYFVRATLNDSLQVSCIASIIKAYGWRRVVSIYEDTEYGRGIIPYLVDVLQEVNVQVPYRSTIPPTGTCEQITKELYKLMTMQTRVYIVHMSSVLASTLFLKAKEIGMMEKGYVWIITGGVTNLIDSLHPSVVESMNGALGVHFYVPKSTELNNFTTRWNMRYRIDNPTDPPSKLSIFGLWSYDTIWAVAQAAEKVGLANATFRKPLSKQKTTDMETLETSSNGPELLKEILQSKFIGLSGRFDLSDRQLVVSAFQIINIIGRGWREIGFWSAQNGLSRKLNQSQPTTHSISMPDLNPVIWPGECTDIPKGFEVPAIGKKLQVGVRPSGYQQFIKVEKDQITGVTKATGLSVDVFEEAVKILPYAVPFEYVLFGSPEDTSSRSYDDFVYQVHLKLQPTVNDIQELLKSGENVGYHRGSYVKGLLEDLGFERSKIKAYDTPDDFHNAPSAGSSNGGIGALVHEVPYIKLFLGNHCKGYTMIGPIYKAAGFGYALAKGNPLLSDISKAILNVTGGDTILQIEKKWIGYQNDCQNVGPITGPSSLTFANFRGLFILTGAASTSSLLIALIIYAYKRQHRSTEVIEVDKTQAEENRENEEKNEPQEENQAVEIEEHVIVQFREDREENGQLHEETGSEKVCDRNPHTSAGACNCSVASHRGEPITVLQAESI